MGMVFIGVGKATMGIRKRNQAGEIVSQTPAKWEPDQAGGCVAITLVDPEKMEPTGAAEIFGDWDAAGYMARALELIHPNRQINVPDLEAMIRVAAKDGFDICDYCQDCNCSTCIVDNWKGENDNE